MPKSAQFFDLNYPTFCDDRARTAQDAQGAIRKMDWELPKSNSETTQKANLHISGYGYQCDLGMTVTEVAVTLDAVKCNLVDPKP